MAVVSERTGRVTATRDENSDGVIDRRDDAIVARRFPTSRTAEQPTIARDDTEVVTPLGPRPRASLLASLSLVLGVVAVLAVLTGVLAAPAIGVGALAALLAIGGISATSSRYVAGKGDAMFGLLFGLGAVVVGVLSLTGMLPWLTGDTNQVAHLHTWLQAHASWMLPS